MKTFLKLSLVLGFLSLLLVGCKKDSSSSLGNGVYYFNCTINGEAYTLKTGYSDIGGGTANIGGQLTNASGTKTPNVNIYIPNYSGAKKYTLTEYTVGDVTITGDSNPEIKGEFTTLTINGSVVTNGKFYLKYVKFN